MGAHVHKTIYGPLIDTALYGKLLMRKNPLLGQVEGGWALGIKLFGPKMALPWRLDAILQGPKKSPGSKPSHLPSSETKEAPLSYVLQESSFASISAVSRGNPSLISLVETIIDYGGQDYSFIPHVQIQTEVISDLKCENQFLSKEIWESTWLISKERSVNRFKTGF